MKFSDIAGNESVKQRLRDMVASDRIPHALLLEGPEGIGKLAMARAFAQYIHCQNKTPDGEPCGVCNACLQHQTFNNADLFFVYPIFKGSSSRDYYCDDYIEEWREFLKDTVYADFSEWVRVLKSGTAQPTIYTHEGSSILQKVSTKSYATRYKIMILWLPEKMVTECANRLLKLIEEPYEDTLFIFVSNQPGKILPTIYSRLQRLKMKRLPMDVIARHLMAEHAMDAQEAMAVASVAEGSMSRAEALALKSDDTHEFLDYFKQIMRSAYLDNLREMKDWAETVADLKREKCQDFLRYMSRMIRENFIHNLNNPSLNYLTREEEAFSSKFFPFINERNVEGIQFELDRVINDIGRNANAKIVLFDLSLRIGVALKK